ncbi:MAG: hypothetical protein ACREFX_03035, partial [Opitutaceae bacterium]
STVGPPLTGWDPALAALFNSLGAFSFPPTDSLDAAVDSSFAPGPHTVDLMSHDGQSGIALLELYDADHLAPADRLINLSARGYAGSGSQVLVGGFVIGGGAPETVLIRAVGPALSQRPFNVPGTLAEPSLLVYDSSPQILASIQGWGAMPQRGPSTVAAGVGPATAFQMSSADAFPLVAGSADCAMILTLPPGSYTAQVSGADGGSGVALVEIYELH